MQPRFAALLALVLAGCPGTAAGQSAPNRPPVLVSFSLNGEAGSARAGDKLALVHTAVGPRPREYRVSTRADFVGAPWLAYEIRPLWDASGQPTHPGCEGGGPEPAATLQVYFQVRVVLGEEIRIVNGQRTLVPLTLDSNVLTDSICLRG